MAAGIWRRRGQVYFVAQEGRLYRQRLAGGDAQPITPQFGHMASPALSPDGRWVLYVHTYEGMDGLAIVDAEGKRWPQKLVYGARLLHAAPAGTPTARASPGCRGTTPICPGTARMLQMADRGHERRRPARRSSRRRPWSTKPDVAVFQPEFSPDGRSLAYISDESGWGNLYLYDLETRHTPRC